MLADLTPVPARPHRFAVYNVAATLAAAAGALASSLPSRLAHWQDWPVVTVERLSFLIYVVAAIAAALVYRGLRTHAEVAVAQRGLHKSRAMVIRLATLFSLDAAGGGFAVVSLLVLYLNLRFGLSARATGATFAAAGVLTAMSQFVSPRLRASDRARAHDGVHAHPRQHLSDHGRHRSERAGGDHLAPHAVRAVADGCARSPGACHARRRSRRTRCRRQPHQRPPQPRVRDDAPARGSAAQSHDVRLAAHHRGRPEDHLRPPASRTTPRPRLPRLVRSRLRVLREAACEAAEHLPRGPTRATHRNRGSWARTASATR